jgi:hypothetical protein
MDYGLLVKNTAGAIQIDSTYTNYALYDHGEGVSTVFDGYVYTKTITFSTPTAQPPLIAIKPSSSVYCGVIMYTRSGSDYTGFVICSSGAVATISWRSFLPRIIKSPDTYGLRIYNNSGGLVFDSGYNAMRISNVDACNPTYNGVVTLNRDSNSDAYFIAANSGYWITIVGSQEIKQVMRYFGMFKYISDTQVSFGGRLSLVRNIPLDGEGAGGYWPSSWTILTIK